MRYRFKKYQSENEFGLFIYCTSNFCCQQNLIKGFHFFCFLHFFGCTVHADVFQACKKEKLHLFYSKQIRPSASYGENHLCKFYETGTSSDRGKSGFGKKFKSLSRFPGQERVLAGSMILPFWPARDSRDALTGKNQKNRNRRKCAKKIPFPRHDASERGERISYQPQVR